MTNHFILLLNWDAPSCLFEHFLSLNLSMDVILTAVPVRLSSDACPERNCDPVWQHVCTTAGLCTSYGSSDTPDLQQYF